MKRPIVHAVATPVIGASVGFGLALVAAIVTSTLLLDESEASGEGDGLAFFLLFLGWWIVLGLVASIAAGVLLSRRVSGVRRRRISFALIASGWLPLAIAVGVAAAWFGGRSGLGFVGGVLGTLVAVALLISAAALGNGTLLARIWLITGTAMLFVVAAVLLLEGGHRRAIYADNPPPMGLVDPIALEEALPGWQLVEYRDAPRSRPWQQASARVVTPSGETLAIVFDPNHRRCYRSTGSCERLSDLEDGSEVWGWQDSSTCGSEPATVGVAVVRPQGVWSVGSDRCTNRPQHPSIDELRTLVSVVVPVSLDEWIAAT